ncbi:hypothetical protein BH20ACI2_BH20ACI2_07900 [soil metagenome]
MRQRTRFAHGRIQRIEENDKMTKRFLISAVMLVISYCCLPTAAAAQNSTPNTTPGAVTRVILIDIRTGKGDEFWADMRKNLKPIYEAYKTAGIIEGYSVATKSTTDGQEDWDVALTITYKNWAAFDDLGSKTDPITLKHYGSAAARTAAANKRTESGTTVQSFLVRQQMLNEWK